MIEPALVPGGIIGRPLDHPPPGGHRGGIGKDSLRSVHIAQDVLHRQVAQRHVPLHRRHLRREVVIGGEADHVLPGDVRRELGALGVLHPVEPGDEEHLHGPPAIPVPLLVERTHPTDTRPESLGNHGGMGRVIERGDGHLPFGGGGAADRAHLPVRPGLAGQPVDGIIPVRRGRAENVPLSLGKEPASFVLHHVGVAPAHRIQHRRDIASPVVPGVPIVEVVRRPHEDHGDGPRSLARAVDVRGQGHAIPHRHHHFALHDGNRFKLGEDRIARGGRLGAEGHRDRHGQRGGQEEWQRAESHGLSGR